METAQIEPRGEPIMKSMKVRVDSFSFKNQTRENQSYKLESTLETGIGIDKTESNKIGRLVLKITVCGEKGSEEPFNLEAQISGYFDYDLETDDETIKKELELDGIRLVYPNLRSLVTSLTGDALIRPFQLPLIHLNGQEQQ